MILEAARYAAVKEEWQYRRVLPVNEARDLVLIRDENIVRAQIWMP